MPAAEDLLNVARKYLGVTENPPGSNQNPFSQGLGRPAEPWCADFVVSVCREAGVGLPNDSAYTPTMANGFKSAGSWGGDPQPGDIVFYDFPDATTGIQHVGIVEQVIPGWIVAIEGNTTAGEAGVQDNGGGVYRRRRLVSYVVGYGRPSYAGAPAPPPPPPPPVRGIIKRGSKGANVKYLQERLGVAADGQFGPITQAAVVAFQKSHGLVPDGIVGPLTWAKV